APLAMADQRATRTSFHQHRGGNVAGEGAGLLLMAILPADQHIASERCGSGDQRRGQVERHVNIAPPGGKLRDSAHLAKLGREAVHLPIACDELAPCGHDLRKSLYSWWPVAGWKRDGRAPALCPDPRALPA